MISNPEGELPENSSCNYSVIMKHLLMKRGYNVTPERVYFSHGQGHVTFSQAQTLNSFRSAKHEITVKNQKGITEASQPNITGHPVG